MILREEQRNEIEKSLWVVNAVLKKHGLQADDDMRSFAYYELCRCITRFDPSRAVKWTTFAYRSLFLAVTRERERIRIEQSHFVNTENIYYIKEQDEQEMIDDIMFCDALKVLTEHEKKIVEMLCLRRTYKEIADALKQSEKQTRDEIKIVKEKLKKSLDK